MGRLLRQSAQFFWRGHPRMQAPLDESQNSSHNIRQSTGNLRQKEEFMKIEYVRVSKNGGVLALDKFFSI